MSLWFHYRDKDGRKKLMSVGTDPLVGLTIVGILVALLLPLLQWLRELLR